MNNTMKFSEVTRQIKETDEWQLYPLLLAVDWKKRYAYVTFGGMSRPYDKPSCIRGNTFVLCPSLFRIKDRSYYVIDDRLLYDYVALKINALFQSAKKIDNIDDIEIEVKDKEEQFAEIRNDNDDFKDLLPQKYDGEKRKIFDECFAEIAADNFTDLDETKERIRKLKECFEKIIDSVKKYTLNYEDKRRYCLPLFYNVEIAQNHKSDLNAYFNVTFVFLKKLYSFLDNLLKEKNLQQLETYDLFSKKNSLDKIMPYASHSVCYLQWKRLHSHLNKLLLPKTFLARMYEKVCFYASKDKYQECKDKYQEYIENLSGIAMLYDENEPVDSDLDYLVDCCEDEHYDEKVWIQVINENDFEKSKVKKYLDGLKKYSAFFKLSAINMSTIREEYKYYDHSTQQLYEIGDCINTSCWNLEKEDCNPPKCKYSECKWKSKNGTPLKKEGKLTKHWQEKDHNSFFYNMEALNTLKNLFAVRVLYKENGSWYDIAKINRTFVTKAIRIFSETVMLVLYRSGYIPAFYSFYSSSGNSNSQPIPYLANEKTDEERITSSAVNNGKYAINYIEKISDQDAKDAMKNIVFKDPNESDLYKLENLRLGNLLEETNPYMHGAEYFPEIEGLDQLLDDMQEISKNTLILLEKKRKKKIILKKIVRSKIIQHLLKVNARCKKGNSVLGLTNRRS